MRQSLRQRPEISNFAYSVVAQLLEEIVFHLGRDDSAKGEAEIIDSSTADISSTSSALWALLLDISYIPIRAAYAGVALRRYTLRARRHRWGFGYLWRSFPRVRSDPTGQFPVSKKMGACCSGNHRGYDPLRELPGQIQMWDDTSEVITTLVLATWDRESFGDRAVALGFAATGRSMFGAGVVGRPERGRLLPAFAFEPRHPDGTASG